MVSSNPGETTAPHPSWVIGVSAWVAIGLSLFQLWQPLAGFLPPGVLPFESILGAQPATYFRPIHLVWVLCLGFLVYPISSTMRYLDGLCIGLTLWAGWRIVTFDYQGIDHLLNGLSTADFVAGSILILATLDMARRSVGVVMMLIGLVALIYAAYGNLLPDILATKGFTVERIVRFQVFTGAGLFGAPLGIAAGAVFSFVLFGAFLQVTGAGRFLIDLSFALAGRSRGGPAKASVIASAAMGSISGSAIANTVTTGALTIPMMKKLGYRPDQAAGIEAAASTGGQIMPPIMGAGAFVMAEFTKTAYGDIVWMALVPALLYFTSVLLYVHLMAVKADMTGLEGDGQALHVMLRGLHFLLPLVLITLLLLWNYSPVLVGVAGCAGVLAASFLRAHTRIGLVDVLAGLQQGARLAISISVACAVAGIVVGTIGQSGVGLQFTESVVSLSEGRLWLALVLVALAALVLGMGLPATAAYIVLAVMTGPALQELGLALITAHMIIFWLAQSSNVTPPIALAAFAGAGIAGASPMRSAVSALRLASGLFVIPLMMAYSPLLLNPEDGWLGVFLGGLFCAGIIVALATSLEGVAFAPLPLFARGGLLLAAGLMAWPHPVSRSLGLGLLAILLALSYRWRRAASSP